MTKKNYYILSHGKIYRKKDTIYIAILNSDNEIEKRVLPIRSTHAIYAYGRVGISSGAIHLLAKNRIPVHFFNKYRVYISTLYPRKYILSGYMTVRQAQHYLDRNRRTFLAKAFVMGSIKNMLKNIRYYNRVYNGLDKYIDLLEELLKQLDESYTVNDVMSLEGRAKHIYYKSWNEILPEPFKYDVRTRRPPKTMLDALISLGNMQLYATTLSEIYHTRLDPTISYLHEPSERRYSLALDISEIFKPIIVDRVIFTLILKNIISKDDFYSELNYTVLNRNGLRKFLELYEERLNTTVKHKTLKRKVSIRYLIRLECYKLMKHLIGLNKYSPLISWL